MNIDWFTFVAQIVNFLVLVGLLRWLLYGPIIRAMNRREEKIAGRLEEANQRHEEAKQRVQEYEQKQREIKQQREDSLKDARQQAQEEHQRLLKNAKQEVDRQREHWQETLRREQDDFLADLRRQAGEMGLQAVRRALAQLADVDLENYLCDAFASRLEQLDDEQRETILHHLNEGGGDVSIRSAFDLPDEQRERLRKSIDETFEWDANVSFERSSDLICGLMLDIGGYSFGWNMKEFLRDVNMKFTERLTETK